MKKSKKLNKEVNTTINLGTVGINNMDVTPTLTRVECNVPESNERVFWHDFTLSFCQRVDTAGSVNITINTVGSDELRELASLLNELADKIDGN